MNLIPPLLCLVALVIPVESTIFSTLLLVQPIRCKNSHPKVLYNTKYYSHYLSQPSYIGKVYTSKSHCDHFKSKSSNSFFFPSHLSLEYRKPKFYFKQPKAPYPLSKHPHHLQQHSHRHHHHHQPPRHHQLQQQCEPCRPVIDTPNTRHTGYEADKGNFNLHNKFEQNSPNLLGQQNRPLKQIVTYPPGYRGTAQVSHFIDDEVEPMSSS